MGSQSTDLKAKATATGNSISNLDAVMDSTSQDDVVLSDLDDESTTTPSATGESESSANGKETHASEEGFMIHSGDDFTGAHPPPSPSDHIETTSATSHPNGISQGSYPQISVASSVHGDAPSLGDSPQEAEANIDLLIRARGMYRLLELYGEQGSGGLVDKVLISRESVSALINFLSPGAYASITKVDFGTLDQLAIKPLGVYGNKSEIVKLLKETGVINEQIGVLLLAPGDPSEPNQPVLRPGLYAVLPSPPVSEPEGGQSQPAYIIFWPEETTWNDDAISSVRRNRVTFIRYLSKITDQLLALISPSDAEAMVWSDGLDDLDPEEDTEDFDRLYNFKVLKTKDQQEDVKIRPGFTIGNREIRAPTVADGLPVDYERPELQPRLLAGETRSGFLTAAFKPRNTISSTQNLTLSELALRAMLEDTNHGILLGERMRIDDIKILIQYGLGKRCPLPVAAWEKRDKDARSENSRASEEIKSAIRIAYSKPDESLDRHLKRAIVQEVLKLYPVDEGALVAVDMLPTAEATKDYVERIVQLHPRLNDKIMRACRDAKMGKISDKTYRRIKQRFLAIRSVMETPEAQSETRGLPDSELARLILSEEELLPALTGASRSQNTSFVKSAASSLYKLIPSLDPQKITKDKISTALYNAEQYSDPAFITDLIQIQETQPALEALVTRLHELFYADVRAKISSTLPKLRDSFINIQREDELKNCTKEAGIELAQLQQESFQTLAKELEEGLSLPHYRHRLHINSVILDSKRGGRVRYSNYFSMPSLETYKLDISEERDVPAQIEYTVNEFSVTQDDTQQLSANSQHIPQPVVRPGLSGKFCLAATRTLRHIQLLGRNKCLLLVDDVRAGQSKIYLEDLTSIDNALSREDAGTRLTHERVGSDFLFSVDESKGLLSIFSTTESKYRLHIYAFDETFTRLHARGSPIDLTARYSDSRPRIRQTCFVNGSEEILLLEESGVARIYSMVTMQFRPSRLILKHIPKDFFSTPDGSCLITVEHHESQLTLRAFHWASFGSHPKEIIFSLNISGTTSFAITSYANRSCVYFLCLRPETHECLSFALDITKKVSEFSFRAHKSGRGNSDNSSQVTRNNCLIDCHTDVWTRFPVFAPIKRATLTSTGRCRPSIAFVTDRDHEQYSRYFDGLVRTFERTKRKPTNRLLDAIRVSACPLQSIQDQGLHSDVSVFKVGEWFVELFCLIPIHIAIASSNRLIPLKDGIYSPEYERSLLGADIGKIVESLSLGWYESIFRSYMATMPVKVVTSMGEQSVGKSYALNHLVDTSFAGSAMRCTEGVWLSLTPTRDTLIVALDFEGVHSIERSAQEDTLLVLLNAAISNLVLFRNNFVLSRDIAGLFASFQSSSSVLDPAANPSLFQSTLAIIIKDVVDSDKEEIVKEFQLKLQKIVLDEQEQNFITKMHAGNLDIIPWPVIESARFYSTFALLRRCLERQPSSHGAAGVFLRTLKTLMAKIKVCDWGSLDQNLVSLRVQQLLAALPVALSRGLMAVHPEPEPLKDMDTDKVIPSTDSNFVFYIRDPDILPDEDAQLKAQRLSELGGSWEYSSLRHTMADADWAEELALHLRDLTQRRIQHVQDWLAINISRFAEDHADIRNLHRAFQNGTLELQASVELCCSVCATCNFLCIQGKRHDGLHHCGTSHNCVHECEFEHDEEKSLVCGLPAGHAGRHSCDARLHSCGQACALEEAGGCLKTCSQPADHAEEEHRCSARYHTCNKPCDLNNPQTPLYCGGFCETEWGVPHTQHVCKNKLLCPIQCQLCKHLCAEGDHLHGLASDSVHLCGQEHSCSELCEMPGICDIDPSPQSVESTFTGKHEQFRYTKFTQIAKRLPCVIPIPPDDVAHVGPHVHNGDPTVPHKCEARCPSCTYFCTLDLDHSQLEHETRHGSMSQTTWLVDGPDDTLEIQGHKFATGDSGAPMLCSLFCNDMGRHTHISPCRSSSGICSQPEVQHINAAMGPNPDEPKDWITHRLFWARTGFKDPYSTKEQAEFAKCDAMCPGPEHDTAADANAKPSFCILPLFHPKEVQCRMPAGSYISTDGHKFNCNDPALLRQAYHVIFAIDRSGSMMYGLDHLPLTDTPNSSLISGNKNRFGAVLSALDCFWTARDAATASGAHATRKDAYSIILFDHSAEIKVTNDFTSSPSQLLRTLLYQPEDGGTNFEIALRFAQTVMQTHWSSERSPVLIFLSDGESRLDDNKVYDICRSALSLGKSLSLHAVSFGEDYYAGSLRKMAKIAGDIQAAAPMDQQGPPCGYTPALDTVQLAQTFLGIAESMRKPRAALFRQ